MIYDRYPNADILAQRGHWDEATRQVVLDRVYNVPPFRYFDAHERATLEALCARVVPQRHRPPDKQIPIAPWIDQTCHNGFIEGFRFDDMPEHRVAWRWGLTGLDQTSHARFGGRDVIYNVSTFAALDGARQDEALRMIRAGDPPGEVWTRMPGRRWWTFIALRQITGVYYAHPYAWDEIGFGGPAYPRGYLALNHGAPEPWEAREASPPWEGKPS
jgi:hypothetical protein